jgi:hypothetical protein
MPSPEPARTTGTVRYMSSTVTTRWTPRISSIAIGSRTSRATSSVRRSAAPSGRTGCSSSSITRVCGRSWERRTPSPCRRARLAAGSCRTARSRSTRRRLVISSCSNCRTARKPATPAPIPSYRTQTPGTTCTRVGSTTASRPTPLSMAHSRWTDPAPTGPMPPTSSSSARSPTGRWRRWKKRTSSARDS